MNFKNINEDYGFEDYNSKSETVSQLGLNLRKLNKFSKDLFYQGKDWKMLREEVLLHYGKKCMKCKSRTKIIQVDHIKPRYYRPDLALCFDNLQVLCKDCNDNKGIREVDYRKTT